MKNSNYDALCVLVMQKMQKANYASKCLGLLWAEDLNYAILQVQFEDTRI